MALQARLEWEEAPVCVRQCRGALMTPPPVLGLLLLVGLGSALNESNLTCYQCVRYANEECGNESLKVCPASKDRCVTHISKDEENGFVMKRECGLGPCGFEDAMMSRGLGLEGCDRSKDEYFCVFCCPTSGCNKDSSSTIFPCILLLFAATALVAGLTTVRHLVVA